MTSEEKIKFRRGKTWKEFRLKKIQEQSDTCELSGMVYKGAKQKAGLECHHHDPLNYDDLEMEKFSILNSTMHNLVEYWITRIKGKNFKPPKVLKLWLPLIYKHLTIECQQKLKEMNLDYFDEEYYLNCY